MNYVCQQTVTPVSLSIPRSEMLFGMLRGNRVCFHKTGDLILSGWQATFAKDDNLGSLTA